MDQYVNNVWKVTLFKMEFALNASVNADIAIILILANNAILIYS